MAPKANKKAAAKKKEIIQKATAVIKR